MSQILPTLEELRHAPEAAWLWDAARGRLVWANKPGIAAFGGQSIFDLVDRPFDLAEPGIADLALQVATLPRQTSLALDLAFPSLGKTEPFKCTCFIHTLSDGRDGILAIEIPAAAKASPADVALDDFPLATATIDENGTFVAANALAKSHFDGKTIKALHHLLVPEGKAAELLARLKTTGLISTIANFNSPFGLREARLTLRRAKTSPNVFATLVLEDITERRLLEKQLSSAPTLAPNDKQAFEALGRTLNAATAEKPKTPKPLQAAQQDVNSPPHPAHTLAALPQQLRQALERNPSAFAIQKNSDTMFISESLARLCGYASTADALSNSFFLPSFKALNTNTKVLALPNGDGTTHAFKISSAEMPWLNGKAQHYTFEKFVEPANDVLPEVVAEVPAPSPVPPVQRPTGVVVEDAKPIPPKAIEPDPHSILDIASDGIITLDKTGKILSFSAGAEAIFGYRNAEVLNKPLADFLNPESTKILESYLASLDMIGLASVFNDGREVQAIVKQGGTVPLFLNIGRIQAEHSQVEFCAVLRDLTNWKRTEKELRQAKEQAEEASKLKSDFLARVSHELRTPLNAILGFSDIMRLGQFGDIKNERYRAYVNDIHTSGSHLLAMINDLLDLSKIESGRMELDFTAVNLNDCFDHASRLLQEQATRARVLMRKSFPNNLPRIVADQRSLRQIMTNLLSNAIKYTDAGGQVIVSAATTKSGGLVLRLKDTGIGMKASELAQALQPFSRVDTPGRERQGTGLGLPLTKALVEANRASFNISSEPGQGTLVEITFPTTRVLAE